MLALEGLFSFVFQTMRNKSTNYGVLSSICLWDVNDFEYGGTFHCFIYFLAASPNIPSVPLGVVTNLLPSVMLTILVSLVFPFSRLMGRFAGKPTLSSIE